MKYPLVHHVPLSVAVNPSSEFGAPRIVTVPCELVVFVVHAPPENGQT